MTPERQKWWDSLPAEEKRVRRSIEWQQEIIAYNKALMNDEISCDYGYLEKQNREAKHAIKALRKQIAMRPYVLKTTIGNFDKCPCCSVRLIKYFPHCACCGQKLRW